MNQNTLFYKKNPQTPIWLMRQAGRYLPEYKETRKLAGNFLDLCYNPKLAAEVTIQPITRFDFDAAIIFSDILVILNALGLKVEFEENIGPIIEYKESSKLNKNNFDTILTPVYKAIKLVRNKLDENKILIGFSGCPWTLATYYIEGKTSKDFAKTRNFAYSNEKEFAYIIDLFTDVIIEYLYKQIESGAQVLKLFDSWAGVLSEIEYKKYVINPNKKIVSKIREKYQDINIICFPKGSGHKNLNFVQEVQPDILAIDYTIELDWAVNNLSKYAVLQGNLDPCLLASNNTDYIKTEVSRIKEKLGKNYFIFNLGHGILPHTPIENVELLVKLVRS